MTDPSINLKRVLKGHEEALWGLRISSEARAADRKRSIRGASLFVGLLLFILVYAIYANRASLFKGEPAGAVSSPVMIIVVTAFAIGIAITTSYVIFALRADLAEEKPSIYLITTKRLIAAYEDYRLADQMAIGDIAHVFTVGKKNRELFVERKNREDLKDGFYMNLLPDPELVKSTIESLIRKDDRT